jgi:DNA mismatch repair ATPase MutS
MEYSDKKTRKELNILKDDNNNFSLLDLLDRTVTFDGRQKLAEYLKNPLEKIEEIESFQNTITKIKNNLEAWHNFRNLLKSNDYKEIDKYQNYHYLIVNPNPLFGFIRLLFTRNKSPIYSFLEKTYFYAKQLSEKDPNNLLLNNILESLSHLKFLKKKSLITNQKIVWLCFVKERACFSQIMNCLYKIDALISVVVIHDEFKLIFPKWNLDISGDWGFTGLRNIGIKTPVANDIILSRNTKLVFITGPNMAGKTAFLTALGQSIYIAKCGFGVPATSAIIPWFTRLETAFEVASSISNGISYFSAEVNRAIQILNICKQGNYNIILIDELFKGTNIKDSQDCIKYLIETMNKNSTICFISTHLTECVTNYENEKDVDFRYFEAQINEQDLYFDYLLKNGISRQKLGLHIFSKRWKENQISDE